MAITAIDVFENNIENGVNLMAIHNPLTFIAEVTYTNTAPDTLQVVLTDDNTNYYTYDCVYYADISLTKRQFIFIADEVLRSFLPTVADVGQGSDTIVNSNITNVVSIYFTDGVTESTPFSITICHAARDYTDLNGALMVDEYNNETKRYTGIVGELVYQYWYNDDANNDIINFDPTKLMVLSTVTDTVGANVTQLERVNDGKLSYGVPPEIGEIWFDVIPYTGLGYIFRTKYLGGEGGIFSNVIGDFSYTLTEIGSNEWILEIAITTNPTNGQYFQFNYTLTGKETQTIRGEFKSYTIQHFDVGFIKKAITPTSEGEITSHILIDWIEYYHTVKAVAKCTNDIKLRYIDRNGQYRFMLMSSFYKAEIRPESIGDIDLYVVSLKDSASNTQRIGYKNKDTLTMRSHLLDADEITLLKDLYNSNDVTIYLNSKWVSVTIKGDNIYRYQKKDALDIILTVELPQSYNLTKL